MSDERSLLIKDVSGFTPQIGHLVSMMNYARSTTLTAVADLTVEQLDFLHDEQSNSIGMLLRHLAAVESIYQILTFEKRSPLEEEIREWQAALELGDRGRREIKGYTLDEYLICLRDVRLKTFEEFEKRDDDWLYEEVPFWNEKPANYYFQWFHVFEDEINHRGQIRWLRQRLPKK